MFIRSASFVFRVALLIGLSQHSLAEDGDYVAPAPLNVVLITADDLNYDSVGCYGCEIPDITPNIDGLASEGMLFNHGYVNVAVCQPCRQSIMTPPWRWERRFRDFVRERDSHPTLPNPS